MIAIFQNQIQFQHHNYNKRSFVVNDLLMEVRVIEYILL